METSKRSETMKRRGVESRRGRNTDGSRKRSVVNTYWSIGTVASIDRGRGVSIIEGESRAMTNAFIIHGGWPAADTATVNNSRPPLRIAPCHADVVSIAFRPRQGNFSTRYNGLLSRNRSNQLMDPIMGCHPSFFLPCSCPGWTANDSMMVDRMRHVTKVVWLFE